MGIGNHLHTNSTIEIILISIAGKKPYLAHKMDSLYNICVSQTAGLLKSHHWKGVTEDFQPVNHFSSMPSTIVDDLFAYVVDMLPHPVEVSDVHLLLSSGRLQHFKLEHVLITREVFITMLMNLSSASKELRSLVLRKLAFSNPYTIDPIKRHLVSGTIECLVRMSPHLELLESCIAFNLKSIRNSEHLKVLKVNFVPETPLSNFLIVDGDFWSNHTLSVIEVYQDIRNPVHYLESMHILKYCKALTNLNIDISCCLEYMHTEEMDNGTLDTQYKLQKCFLGSESNGPATITALHIATLTCPFIKEVDILASDNHVIYGLRDFENLSNLLVQWESPNGGNFQLGIQMLLETMGKKLKTLHLLNFFTVDFAALALNAPALEELKVEYLSEYCGQHGTHNPAECFTNLKNLILENTDSNISVSENTIVMLLSSCPQLTNLSLFPATHLNDAVLSKVLAKNTLSNVKELALADCALTGEGIKLLAENLRNLRVFDLSSSEIDFEEAAAIVHSLNVEVVMVEI
ncbi:hypothetical protein JTE90_022898 [Oedothorax gibbosus]|uniref:Uncharacterized protein n=1 Tax=Oedothorax gibbosus TaxID=931172 RepID=A0AAV6UVJ8_9ARAC|nr:hypothetical protein JTE90_022898 [Oedothorax gibbosus]